MLRPQGPMSASAGPSDLGPQAPTLGCISWPRRSAQHAVWLSRAPTTSQQVVTSTYAVVLRRRIAVGRRHQAHY